MKKTNLERDKANFNNLIAEIIAKLDKKALIEWGCSCVERILSNFEEKYPKDNRPRKALHIAQAWSRGEVSIADVRAASLAAHAAARKAKTEDENDACYVARAAGHVVAIAHVSKHAKGVTFYIAKIDPKELKWQYEKLLAIEKESKIKIEKKCK